MKVRLTQALFVSNLYSVLNDLWYNECDFSEVVLHAIVIMRIFMSCCMQNYRFNSSCKFVIKHNSIVVPCGDERVLSPTAAGRCHMPF